MPVITRTATLEDLMARIERLNQVQTMKATVELHLSVENADRTRVQEFRDAPGFIVARRPEEILTIAQLPVVRTTAFRMASNGETYQMHVPPRKRFFVGDATQDEPSEAREENIRPQHILEALMIEPPRANEVAVLENVIEGPTPYQVVSLVRTNGAQKPKITRKFWFTRSTLELSHMQILDDLGDTATLARYEQWNEEGPLPYASLITVIRPADGYSLRIHFLQPGLNAAVADVNFQLEAPEGVTVERIGEDPADQRSADQRAAVKLEASTP